MKYSKRAFGRKRDIFPRESRMLNFFFSARESAEFHISYNLIGPGGISRTDCHTGRSPSR